MNTQDAAVAQSVVRRIGSAEVTGPIPVSSSSRLWYLPEPFLFVSHFVLHFLLKILLFSTA